MTDDARDHVFTQVEAWYARAPEGLDDGDTSRWVQRTAEIACPECGDPLWVMRTRRAQNRGYYHLAMCQSPHCTFQIDD